MKMRKSSKKKSLLASWEGPCQLMVTRMAKEVMNKMKVQEFVFIGIKMVKLGREQDEICKFTIHLEVLIYADIYFLCWEWQHM